MRVELGNLDALGGVLTERARRRGVMLVWRAQARVLQRVLVRRGRAEDSGVTSVRGHGMQVFCEDGGTALGSRDDFREQPALALLERTMAAARQRELLGLAGAAPCELSPLRAHSLPAGIEAFDRVDLADVAERLAEIEAEISSAVPGIGLRLRYTGELDGWRIMRSDGTDVTFVLPRFSMTLLATGEGNDSRHGVSATVFGSRPGLHEDHARVGLLLRRARRAAELARRLPDAPPHPAGSFPLVIDYALAKGLAHEAFGHASEADGFRSSVLARDGRFLAGDEVGASHVSIVDEPVEGDHAWQPFSSNGLRRERVTIVDHGRLADALSDPWSAGPAGVRVTGAARASSFRDAPLPRMSNIRIEVDEPLVAEGSFEDYDATRVRDLLAREGVFRRHREVVFLSGYAGGQVNTATGDFVFNCKAIYRLDPKGAALHKPAIFSGSMFGALRSVREGFGPLLLDALGHCGKWGQSVPSSGGSHYFLVLEPHDDVRLGGS